MNRSDIISTSPIGKFELANSPYLESLSVSNFSLGPKFRRRVVIADDLYQAISERKRAQSILKELERRLSSLKQEESKSLQIKEDDSDRSNRRSLPSDIKLHKQRLKDQEMRHLEERRLKIKIENEELKMRMEEQKEVMLQRKRVTFTQRQVLLLKETILKEKRLSPERRKAKREEKPRFLELPEIREPRSHHAKEIRMRSQSPSYDEQLRREKEVISKLKQRVTFNQTSQLAQEEKTLQEKGRESRTKRSNPV